MIWETILCDRPLGEIEIIRGFSELFALPASEVRVVPMEILWDVPDSVQVVVEQDTTGGEFPTHLSVVLRGEKPERIAQETRADTLVGRLCGTWRCRCLISDDTPNPYRWVLIRPGEEPQVVHLDADRLDAEDEEVVIAHYGDYPDSIEAA